MLAFRARRLPKPSAKRPTLGTKIKKMAGYSGTPLPRKLGIAAGHCVGLLKGPPRFSLGELPEAVSLRTGLRGRAPLDVILFFAKAKADVEKQFSALVSRLT